MDPASNQMSQWAQQNKDNSPATLSAGQPVDNLTESMTVGPRGPIVLNDLVLINNLASFDRERVPERVVHAKGSGAFGYFEVTTDYLAQFCRAKMFDKVGKRTPMLARFSQVSLESGSADTVRDPRGFALKFYTEEGNWDMVGNNTPIFFISDPMLFPSLIHVNKRNPVTHLKDPNMKWDFFSLRPESVHQVTRLYHDLGTPDGWRHMDGFGSHTFKNVNSKGEAFFVKYHFRTDQGVKNLPAAKAAEIAGMDPDYATRDLFNAIAEGNCPSWTLYVQVATPEQVKQFPFNPFDVTKVWSEEDYPLKEVGRFTLNKNPTNWHMDIESAAFNPGNLVPGIEPSPDKMLQARLFSYGDTQRYRLGPNHEQLPVNRPLNFPNPNYQKDGPQRVDNQDGKPNYFPNSFNGPGEAPSAAWDVNDTASGNVARYPIDTDHYWQCKAMWDQMTPDEQDRLTTNMAESVKMAAEPIRNRWYGVLEKVDKTYASQVHQKVDQAHKEGNIVGAVTLA
ncbi:catalase-like domain-containing protein [Tribonema minus]|uniref:Catalase n=1 Tax=Tribonema minus TaxID=303371 RepID=A0A835ZD64_9STRA|nr:catalase-like domain-containing protein [Tribonema minus]KAG5188135.1 catalase-like domain-containing protein [Tribonema minus]